MLSSEDIHTIVERAFDNEPVEIINYHQKSHSKDKVGFLGDHQNLEIQIKRKGSAQTETHHFFVKALPKLSESQTEFIRNSGVFSQEAAFFNVVFPELQVDYAGDQWCPRRMLANSEVLVLEDMRTKNYAMRESKIFEGEYLKSALRAQARMHAASILAEARLGEPLNELCPAACVEVLFNERMLENNRLGLYSDLAEKIAQRLGREPRRIKTAFEQGFMRMYKPEKRGKLERVLCHGDTWPNNSLFDSSQPPKCVLVDFQLTRYAPRMYDVIQLMYLSTTREIRRREEREAIEAYHDELCDTLERNNPSIERPRLEDLVEEYEDLRMSALLASVMYYPIICMSKKELGMYEDQPDELYKKVMLREDNTPVMEIYDRDREYAQRLDELVLEVLEHSERLNAPAQQNNGVSTGL